MTHTNETKKNRALRYVGRSLLVLLVTVLIVALALYGVMWVLVKGPSPTAKRLFVLSVKETSAAGFLAHLYLSNEEIDAILAENRPDMTDEDTDTSLIKIDPSKIDVELGDRPSGGDGGTSASDGIEIVPVDGGTYKGVMMIVHDPSRLFVGRPDTYGEGSAGLTLRQMMKKYNAAAGINAGGFYDPNGSGTGGIPDGIVISGGELLWGKPDQYSCVIGFDANYILRVGYMSGARAMELGLREAVSFGPVLISNKVPQNAKGSIGGGINPRTAIGQREDGAVLLLTIEGRQISSLGATYDDLIDVMLSFGAVNAANLDGGSSSLMCYGDEVMISSAYVYGERVLSTAFMVK